MEKIENGESLNIIQQNIDQLKALFPSIVTEDKIDFDALRQLMGDEVEVDPEYYRFTWPGKAQARAEALKPSTGTLRPAPEESLDWDTTKNLYIEGDNLEVLKLLQKSYASKVKMIYIDPPYNTGKDFVYKDNYRDNLANYKEKYNRTDEDGNLISSAAETNAEGGSRYHSNWLNMMYPRLQLARNLLKDDGVIFMSIDDNEVGNLKKICNEIFGEENFAGQIVRSTGTTTGQDANKIGSSFDYLLVYTLSMKFRLGGLPLSEKDKSRFTELDSKGRFAYLQLRKTGNADRKEDRPNMHYPIKAPNGDFVLPIGPTGYESRWRVAKITYEELLKEDYIFWKENRNGEITPYVKYYLEGRKKQVSNLWDDVDGNKKGSIELKKSLGSKSFDNPKPTKFLKRLYSIATENIMGDIVLDFFSGSASSAHAVLNYNLEENKQIQYIQVQLPQPTDEKSEAYKAGYHTIAEIGKERIRRVVSKIKEEIVQKVSDKEAEIKKLQGELQTEETTKDIDQLRSDITALQQQDLGMKVLKLDSTNIKPWDPDPAQLETNLYSQDNIKEGRSESDILYEILLKYGLDLTLPVEERSAGQQLIHSVGGGALFVCLSMGITRDTAQAIIDWATELDVLDTQPKVVFRDSGFTSDVEKTNVHQLLQSAGVEDVKSL